MLTMTDTLLEKRSHQKEIGTGGKPRPQITFHIFTMLLISNLDKELSEKSIYANWLNIVKPKRQEGKEARMSRRLCLTEVHNTFFFIIILTED